MDIQNSDIVDVDVEEQHELAFGEHTGISPWITTHINQIRNNDPEVVKFFMSGDNTPRLSELAWELLGRYIANNTHLSVMKLANSDLIDDMVVLLFRGLVRSDSISEIDMSSFVNLGHYINQVGAEGIRSMIPFLQNSPQLKVITFSNNNSLGNEAFVVLMNALDGGPIEELRLHKCSISDISALDNVTLPRLKRINLSNNSIGREGIIVLSNILQQEGSTLTKLYLESTGIGDESIEILANSLKHNTSLTILGLGGNNIREMGCKAILKLLNDVSSIEKTYNSNHTLIQIKFVISKYIGVNNDTPRVSEMKRLIRLSLQMNRQCSSTLTGKAKVIHTQLNSGYRTELAAVQGINKDSYLSIFSEIDALVLPEVLAMVARDGQTELYCMLTAVVPDLASTVNKDAALIERIEERSKYKRNFAALKREYKLKMNVLEVDFIHSESKVAALSAENLKLKEELELIQSEQEKKEWKWRRTNLILSGLACGMILLAWKGKGRR